MSLKEEQTDHRPRALKSLQKSLLGLETGPGFLELILLLTSTSQRPGTCVRRNRILLLEVNDFQRVLETAGNERSATADPTLLVLQLCHSHMLRVFSRRRHRPLTCCSCLVRFCLCFLARLTCPDPLRPHAAHVPMAMPLPMPLQLLFLMTSHSLRPAQLARTTNAQSSVRFALGKTVLDLTELGSVGNEELDLPDRRVPTLTDFFSEKERNALHETNGRMVDGEAAITNTAGAGPGLQRPCCGGNDLLPPLVHLDMLTNIVPLGIALLPE